MMELQMTTEDIDIVLREVGAVLKYHLHLGIDGYPSSAQLDAFLNVRPLVSALEKKETRTVAGRRVGQGDSGIAGDSPAHPVAAGPVRTIATLATEIAECTRCRLAAERVVPVAGEGPEKTRLLIVGEWLALPQRSRPPAGCVFGVEQDQMLARMLGAIQLSRKEVFITNIIKCGLEENCQPKAEHVTACFPYLQQQIAALAPQIICCMGRVATRVVLGRPEPLSRLRGRLHTHEGPGGRKIPVVATYHPSFLLQNPEMKKATWLDLQLLARQLGIALE